VSKTRARRELLLDSERTIILGNLQVHKKLVEAVRVSLEGSPQKRNPPWKGRSVAPTKIQTIRAETIALKVKSHSIIK